MALSAAALKLLEKLPSDEIKARSRKTRVKSHSFWELLKDSIACGLSIPAGSSSKQPASTAQMAYFLLWERQINTESAIPSFLISLVGMEPSLLLW